MKFVRTALFLMGLSISIGLTGCGNSNLSSDSPSNLSPSASSAGSTTSWVPPAGFDGTVQGDPNMAWKITNTSGDSSYDSQWCNSHFPPCYFYRVAVNEDCSSVSGTLQLINSLGEVEDTVQASSAAAVPKGATTTLVFEANSDAWKRNVKLANLNCIP